MVRELNVVFDTNVIWASDGFRLTNTEIANLVQHTKTEAHLRVRWFIPETVRRERIYQLRRRARQLLSSAKKLEELTGRTSGITEAVIDRRLEQLANRELAGIGFQTLGLNIAKTRWKDIVDSSLDRRPPFELDKEKGFRDALILQSVLQLTDRLKSQKHASCALVTKDKVLRQAVVDLHLSADRLVVLEGPAEVQEHIQALLDDVDEEFITGLRPQASQMFRGDGTGPGLWQTAKLAEQLRTKFRMELQSVPHSWLKRDGESWFIYPPHFNGKQNKKIAWITRVENRSTVSSVSIKRQSPEELAKSFDEVDQETIKGFQEGPTWLAVLGSIALGLSKLKTEKLATHEGTDTFEVLWKASLSDSGALESPETVDLRFAGTHWRELTPLSAPASASGSPPSPS